MHAAASKNRAGVVALLLSQGNVKVVKNRANQFPIDLSAQRMCLIPYKKKQKMF